MRCFQRVLRAPIGAEYAGVSGQCVARWRALLQRVQPEVDVFQRAFNRERQSVGGRLRRLLICGTGAPGATMRSHRAVSPRTSSDNAVRVSVDETSAATLSRLAMTASI